MFVFLLFIFNTRILSVLDAFWTIGALGLILGWFFGSDFCRGVSIGNLWRSHSHWASMTSRSRPRSRASVLSSLMLPHGRRAVCHLARHTLCSPTTIDHTGKNRVPCGVLLERHSLVFRRAPLLSHLVLEYGQDRSLSVLVWLGLCCLTSWYFLISNLCGWFRTSAGTLGH